MKTTVIISILIFLACTITSTALPYNILYVNAANLSPVPPFDTWEKAAPTIQTAIDASSAKDHIIVTNGVYDVGRRITPGYALSNRVLITKNITVRSVNGPKGTIILGKEATGGGNGTGAVRCVFMTTGKIYGFTISNGFTLTSGSAYDSSGGGVYFFGGGLVSGCKISGNSANGGVGGTFCHLGGTVSNCTINGNSSLSGGGVKFSQGATVTDCTISGNSADQGGGATCGSGGQLFACTISGNNADSYGGGVLLSTGATVSDCKITGNSSTSHGGGVYSGDGDVSNCTISGNNSKGVGGGVYSISGGRVSGCTISNNIAYDSGGGVCCLSGPVSDCTIIGNTSYKSGGGAYCGGKSSFSACKISGNTSFTIGGGAYCYNNSAMTNCLINGMNTAVLGGGVFCEDGGELINCTIVGNNASDYGGGICTSNGGTIINSIIYDNQALFGNDNWLNYGSGAAFNYCCITPTNNLPVGNKCIPDDPMFITPGSDYHLQMGSPSIDAGYYMSWMTTGTDLDGNPRIHDGKVDMGCYEFIPEGGGVLIFGIFILFFWEIKLKLASDS